MYSWAVNSLKLQRAIAEVNAAQKVQENLQGLKFVPLKPEELEAKVKETYIRLAGLVIEGPADVPEEVVVSNVRGSSKRKIRKSK